ncbi:MAG: hypothetical protein SNJ74_05780 [Fimbriimonadaceae bacterium]
MENDATRPESDRLNAPDPTAGWAEVLRLAERFRSETDGLVRSALSEAVHSKVERLVKRGGAVPIEALTDPLVREALDRASGVGPAAPAAKTPKPASLEAARLSGVDLGGPSPEPQLATPPAADRTSRAAGSAGPISAPEPPSESGAPEPPNPPDPSKVAEADALLVRARLAASRGQRSEAERLLREASALAPNAPSVLQAIGDAHVEAKRWIEARDAYAEAIRLDPGNVALERKHASAVFQIAQAQLGSTASSAGQFDRMATARAAALYSLFLPGLGHILSGHVGVGAGIMGAWVASVVAFFLTGPGRFVEWAFGRGTDFNVSTFVFAIVALSIHIGSASVLAKDAKAAAKRSVDRPRPPVDLPFE